MADVSITIRKSTPGSSDTSISVTGTVSDAEIEPITLQLTSLLYSAANSPSASGTAPV